MKRISFDFDGTLSRDNVFEMAQKCITSGIEVWIVTSRCTENNYRLLNLYYNNHDLFHYAEKLNIPRERIVFTNLTPKWKFFANTNIDFLAHLDDDWSELLVIDEELQFKNITTIDVDKQGWDKKLKKLLSE